MTARPGPASRWRRWGGAGARWGAAAAVLLLPTAFLVDASAPPGPDPEMLALMPLEPGTTWRYAVFDGGRPSGFRDRQVIWHGQDASAGATRMVSSRYTDHPDGPGVGSDDEYYHVDDDQIVQVGFRSPGSFTELEPAAAVLKAPGKHPDFAVETSFGAVTIKSRTELVERVDVTVSGRTFRNCAHYRSRGQIIGERTIEREYEDWLCPGFGSVRNIDRIPELAQERMEELVSFHGPADDWTSTANTASTPATGGVGSSAGLDQGRTRSVEGTLTRRLVWTDTRVKVGSQTPAGSGERLLLTEYDGTVSSLDTDAGALDWRVRLRGPIVTAPVSVGGLVLVADGAKQLWALSADTGRAQWVRAFADIVSAAPTVADGVVVVASDDGRLTGIDVDSGREVWTASTGVRIHDAPAVGAGLVVTADPAGTLTARTVADGEEVWSSALDGSLGAGPVVHDDAVHTADDAGVVYSHDLASGELRWQSRVRHYPVGALAVRDDAVVTVGDQTHLLQLSPDTGEVRWTRRIGTTQAAPLVVGDDVVTVSRDGGVAVHTLGDGSPSWEWQLPADKELSVEADPGMVGDALVIPARHGGASEVTYYALSLDPADADRDPGVWFAIDARPVAALPAAPVLMTPDDALLVAGFERALTRIAADGTSTELFRTEDYLAGGTPAGDLVIGQRGERWIAVPATGGQPRWSFPAGPSQIGTLPTTGAVSGKPVVFLPVHGVGLAAVDQATGEPLWFEQLPAGPSAMQPLLLPGGDVVHATTTLSRFDRRTGKRLWSYRGATFATMAQADGTVFADVIEGEDGTGLVALDASTGKALWHRPISNSQILVGPVAAEGKVVTVDASGGLAVLDAATGEELWTRSRHTGPAGFPVVGDGVLYVVETGRHEDLFQRDHRVWAHDLTTGRYLGSFEPPAPGYSRVPSQSGTTDGRLLVPTTGPAGSTVLVMEGRR